MIDPTGLVLFAINKMWAFAKGSLGIGIGSDLNYRGGKGRTGRLSKIHLYLDISATNKTDKKVIIKINDVSLYPKKKISFLDFECEGIRKRNPRSDYITVLELEPGDSLYGLDFTISADGKLKTIIDKTDIENCINIPVVFYMKYSVSPAYKEKSSNFEIDNFFENLLKVTEGKESKKLLFP